MKNKAIKDAMNSIENRIHHVYNQGYEDGLKDGKESVQIDETEAYKLGLETAWELARKLSNLGFNDTRKEIFGEKYGLSIDIIKDFSVDEVAAKIKEYEEKRWHEHKYALLIGKVSSQDFSVDEVADERRRGMTREEAIVVIKTFIDNPLFSGEHKAAFNIAIHDIERMMKWNMNELILVRKGEDDDT